MDQSRPNALIINVGDQTEIFTNGRYKSVDHRGMPHKEQERLSCATFYMCEDDTLVGPLEELLDENHPLRYTIFAPAESSLRNSSRGALTGGMECNTSRKTFKIILQLVLKVDFHSILSVHKK